VVHAEPVPYYLEYLVGAVQAVGLAAPRRVVHSIDLEVVHAEPVPLHHFE